MQDRIARLTFVKTVFNQINRLYQIIRLVDVIRISQTIPMEIVHYVQKEDTLVQTVNLIFVVQVMDFHLLL